MVTDAYDASRPTDTVSDEIIYRCILHGLTVSQDSSCAQTGPQPQAPGSHPYLVSYPPKSYVQSRPHCSQHQRRNTPCHICGDVAKHHSRTITSSTKHNLSEYLIQSDDNKQPLPPCRGFIFCLEQNVFATQI